MVDIFLQAKNHYSHQHTVIHTRPQYAKRGDNINYKAYKSQKSSSYNLIPKSEHSFIEKEDNALVMAAKNKSTRQNEAQKEQNHRKIKLKKHTHTHTELNPWLTISEGLASS